MIHNNNIMPKNYYKLNPNPRKKGAPIGQGIQGQNRLDPSTALDAVDLTYGDPAMADKIQRARDMGVSVTSNNVGDLDRQMAMRQSGWQQGFNAVVGGIGSGGLTALENLGYLGDVVGSVNTLLGLEEVNSNWFSDLMKQGKESLTQDMLPIYRENPSEITDFYDSGFYWESLRGVLDSAVGFAIPGMAASKLVGSVQRLARTKALVDSFSTTKSGAQMVNQLGAGYVTNFMEGKMMGLEVYETTYNDLFNKVKSDLVLKGKSEETATAEAMRIARNEASSAANKFMLANKVFMLSDAFTLRSLYNGRQFTRDLAKAPKKVLEKYKDGRAILTGIGKYSKDGAVEALEEIGQNVLQEEFKFQADKNLGFNAEDKRKFLERTINFATSEQALYEGALGFFGGGPQRLVTKVLTGNIGKNKKEEKRYNAQQSIIEQNEEYLKDRITQIQESNQLVNEAIQKDESPMEEFIKDSEFVKVALTNFENGTTEALERSLEEISQGTKPDISNDETIKQKSSTDLSRLRAMEKSWLKATKYNNATEVFLTQETIASLRTAMESYDTQEGELQSQVDSYQSLLVTDESKLTAKEKEVIRTIPENLELQSIKETNKLVKKKIAELTIKLSKLTSSEHQKRVITERNKHIAEVKAKTKQQKAQVAKEEANTKSVERQLQNEKTNSINETSPNAVPNTPTTTAETSDVENATNVSQDEEQTTVKPTTTSTGPMTVESAQTIKDLLQLYPEEKLSAPFDPLADSPTLMDAKVKYQELKENVTDKQPVEEEKVTTDDSAQLTREIEDKADDLINDILGNNMITIEQRDDINRRTNKLIDFINTYSKSLGRDATFNEVVKFIVKRTPVGDRQEVFGVLQGLYMQINPSHTPVNFKDVFGIEPNDLKEIENSKLVAKISRDRLQLTEQELEAFIEEFGNDEFVDLDDDMITYLINNKKVPDLRLFKKGHNIVALLANNYTVTTQGQMLNEGTLNSNLNKNLLDDGFIKTGDKITFRVARDYDGDIYLPESLISSNTDYDVKNGKAVVSFQTFKDRYSSNAALMNDNMPIEVILQKPDGEQVIGYVHATEWLNSNTIATERVSAERTNLRLLRNHIITNSDDSGATTVNTTVTDLSRRVLNKTVQLSNGKHVRSSAKENLGTEGFSIVFGDKDGNLIDQNGKDIDTGNYMNKRFLPGLTYASFDNKTHDEKIGVPLVPTKMVKGGVISNSIINAVTIFNDYNQDSVSVDQKKVRDVIFDKMDYDIFTANGLIDYMNAFIHSYSHVGLKDNSLGSHLKAIKTDNDTSRYYIRTNKGYGGNAIEISRSNGVGYKFLSVAADPTKFPQFIRALETTLENQYFNINKSQLKRGITLIPDLSKPVAVHNDSYKDFALEHTTTDVVNQEIGDGKRSIFSAPLISYDTNDLIELAKLPSEAIVEPIQDFTKPIDPKPKAPKVKYRKLDPSNDYLYIMTLVTGGDTNVTYGQTKIQYVSDVLKVSVPDLVKFVQDQAFGFDIIGNYIVYDAYKNDPRLKEGALIKHDNNNVYMTIRRNGPINKFGEIEVKGLNISTDEIETLLVDQTQLKGNAQLVDDKYYFIGGKLYTRVGNLANKVPKKTEAKLLLMSTNAAINQGVYDNNPTLIKKAIGKLDQFMGQYKRISKEIKAEYDKTLTELNDLLAPSINQVDPTGSQSENSQLDDLFDELDGDASFAVYLPENEELMQNTADLFLLPGLDYGTQAQVVSDIVNELLVKNIVEGRDRIKNVKKASQPIKKRYQDALNSIETVWERSHMMLDTAINEQEADQIRARIKNSNIDLKYSMLKSVVDNWDSMLMASGGPVDRYLSNFNFVKTNSDLELIKENLPGLEGMRLENEDISHGERNNFSDNWSLSIDTKATANRILKKVLLGISDYDNNNNVKKAWFSTKSIPVEQIKPYDAIFNTLKKLLSGVAPDYEKQIAVLEENKDGYPWITQLVDLLNNSSDEIKYSFSSSMSKSYLNMVFVKFDDSGKTFKSTVIDSSNSTKGKAIMAEWKSDIKSSSLIAVEAGTKKYYYNLDTINELLEESSTWTSEKPDILDLSIWLNRLGISINSKTEQKIEAGYYSNGVKVDRMFGSKKVKSNAIPYFDEKGERDIFRNKFGFANILRKQLKGIAQLSENGIVYLDNLNILDDTSITKLATLEAANREELLTDSIRTAGKTIYPHSDNNHFTAQYRRLTNNENGILPKLKQTQYASKSLWLSKLIDDSLNPIEGSYFKENFSYFTADLQPFKGQRELNRSNRELHKLSPTEIEAFRVSMFQRTKRTSGTGARIASFVFPTSSDKTRIVGLNAPVVDVKVLSNGTVSDSAIDTVLDNVVVPELLRMEHYQNNATKIDIAGYADGQNLVYSVPEVRAIDSLFLEDGTLSPNWTNPSNMALIKEAVRKHINDVIDNKLETWEKLGIGVNGLYLNGTYMNRYASVTGVDSFGIPLNLKKAAADMIINYMVANANAFQMFIGDPAVFYKSKHYKKVAERNSIDPDSVKRNDVLDYYTVEDFKEEVSDTFINVGKRLAGDIAPGQDLANSARADQTFRVGYLNDAETISEAIEYYSTLKLKGYKDYTKIEGSDAQEFTTLTEHLRVMHLLGKISKKRMNDMIDASKKNALTDADLRKIFSLRDGEALQPMKPVYVNNVFDNGVYKRVYIKSSSFPLIPQFTKGLAIDALRVAMERDKVDRVAFGTAVKVGNKTNPHNFIENGKVLSEFNFTTANTQTLPRDGFRIQQEVPYKYEKSEIKRVSQASKLLFANINHLTNFDLSTEQLKEFAGGNEGISGKQLSALFSRLHKDIYLESYNALFQELVVGDSLDSMKINVEKLKQMLIEETITRNFPISVVQSILLDPTLKTIKYSPYSDKFEAVLNSIINNRINMIKMPGRSYVLGSEEGFKGVKSFEDLSDDDKNGIKFTKAFYDNGGKLTPHRKVNNEMEGSDILIPWNFKDKEGNLLDINDFLTDDGLIDESKFDPEMLKVVGMRIPNQGHNSMSNMRIVGFLPSILGDLVIASKDLTKQMGSDFDVDKLFTYQQYNIYVPETGRIIRNDEGTKKNKNLMIDIFQTVLQNPDDLVQHYVTEPLEFWKLKEIAAEIDGLRKARLNTKGEVDFSTVNETLLVTPRQLAQINNGSRDRIVLTPEEVLEYGLNTKADKYMLIDNKVFKVSYKDYATIINHELRKDVSAISSTNQDMVLNAELHEQDYFDNKAPGHLLMIRRVKKSNNTFSPLSDDYQRTKFINATAGKAGVGVFSVHSVFNAQLQILPYLNLMENKDTPVFFRFGKVSSTLVSDADLISPYTIESQQKLKNNPNVDRRDLETKTEVTSGYQSGSVDNEKEQILDKLNINSATFGVIGMLNQLGFSIEVPHLTSQDILFDYAELSSRMSSAEAIEEVKKLYRQKAKEDGIHNPDEYKPMHKYPSVEMMKGLIEFGPAHQEFYYYQFALLDVFAQADNYGSSLTKIQTALNVDSSGIPKSAVDVGFKMQDLFDILDDRKLSAFDGIEKILDSFVDEQGESQYSSNTIIGAASAISLPAVNNIYGSTDIFPYGNDWYSTLFKQLDDLFKHTSVEDRLRLIKSLKGRIFTNSKLGLYDSTDLNELRRKLLIDTDTNQSLATGLRAFKNANRELYVRNQFLTRLTTLIENNEESVSKIVYDSSKAEGYIEDGIYSGFRQLFLRPKFEEVEVEWNGELLNSKRIGELLVAYSYITGGLQEAREFNKYIPADYLHSIPFMQVLTDFDVSSEFMEVNDPSRPMTFNDIYSYVRLHDTVLQHIQNYYIPSNVAIQVKPDKEEATSFIINDQELFDIAKNEAGDILSFRVNHNGLERTGNVVDEAVTVPSLIAYGNLIYHVTTTNDTIRYSVLTPVGTSGIKEYSMQYGPVTSALPENEFDLEVVEIDKPAEELAYDFDDVNEDNIYDSEAFIGDTTAGAPTTIGRQLNVNLGKEVLIEELDNIIENSNDPAKSELATMYKAAIENSLFEVQYVENDEVNYALAYSKSKVVNGKVQVLINVPSQGYFENSKAKKEDILLHETTHALTALLIDHEKNEIPLNTTQQAAFDSLKSMRNTLVSRLFSGKLGYNYVQVKEALIAINRAINDPNFKGADTELARLANSLYPFTTREFRNLATSDLENMIKAELKEFLTENSDLNEFVAGALTNEKFRANFLEGQKLPNNKTIKEHLMGLLSKIMSALGIDIRTNPLVYQAYSDTFDLVRYLPAAIKNKSDIVNDNITDFYSSVAEASNTFSKFQAKIDVNNQKLNRLNRRLSTKIKDRKDSKDAATRKNIASQIAVLRESIKNIEDENMDLKKMSDFDEFLTIAAKDLAQVESIVNTKKTDFKPVMSIQARELISLYKFAGDFSDPNNHAFFDEDELEEIYGDGVLNEVRMQFESFANEARGLEAKLVTLERNFIQNSINDTFGRVVTIDWNNPNLDIGWLTSQTIDISEYNNPLLQALHAWVKLANSRTREESEEIYNDVDKLVDAINENSEISLSDAYDLMLQRKGDSDNLTGNLVMPYNSSYYRAAWEKTNINRDIDDRKKLNNIVKSSLKWSRDNEIIVNPLQVNDPDFKQKLMDHVQDEILVNELIKEANNKYEEYLLDRDSFAELAETSYSYQSQDQLAGIIEDWEKANSPLIYSEAVVTPSKMANGKNYEIPTRRYTIAVPQRNHANSWYDANFDKIKEHKEVRDFYHYFKNKLGELNSYLPYDKRKGIHPNYIPAMERTLMEEYFANGAGRAFTAFHDSVKKAVTVNEVGNVDYSYRDPITNVPVKEQQVQYLINNKKRISLYVKNKEIEYKANTGNVADPIMKQKFRDEIVDIIANEKSHDLGKVLKAYAIMALGHKHKNQVEDSVRLSEMMINDMLAAETNKQGTPRLNKLQQLIGTKGKLDNTRNAMNHFLDAFYGYALRDSEGVFNNRLYSDSEKARVNELNALKAKLADSEEEVDKVKVQSIEEELELLGSNVALSSIGDSFLKYVQLKGMAWNVFSAFSNISFGIVSTLNTAASERDGLYNLDHVMKAVPIMLDSVKRNASFNTYQGDRAMKVRALMDKFDTLKESKAELYKMSNDNSLYGRWTKRLKFLTPYNQQTRSEYLIQGLDMVALMMATKVDDTTMWEAYDADGNWTLDVDPKAFEDAFKLSLDKVIKMNHGNYDADSVLLVKKTIFGRMASQFRTWMYEGFRARYGQERFDNQLNLTRKGRHLTGMGVFSWADAGGMKWYEQTHFNTVKLLHRMRLKMLARTVASSKFTDGSRIKTYDEMGFSEVDIANIKSNVSAMIIHASLLLLGLMFKKLASEDDEEVRVLTIGMNTLLNQLNRVETDMKFYFSPFEVQRLNKNLLPIFQLMDDLGKIGHGIYRMYDGEPYFKSGPNKGDHIFMTRLLQSLPYSSGIMKLEKSATYLLDPDDRKAASK